MEARYSLAGDSGLFVEFGDNIDPEINARVRGLAAAVEEAGINGVLEVVPAYASLAVYYDPLRIGPQELEERLRGLKEALEVKEPLSSRLLEVPTVYGGEYGPDLGCVARFHGLSEEEVIAIHTGAEYHTYMLGFTPGFPYLGGMSERIATPRLESPRIKVPAGSVAIGGNQTGIYPTESPGGWRIIGRTYLRLFDPQKDPPALILPGDKVRFVRISEKEYLKAAVSS